MADLLVATHITQLEVLLQREIMLGYGLRQTLAALSDLRALASRTLRHLQALRYVTATAAVYQWNGYSTAPDDGVNVIAPTDAGPAGRWLLTTAQATTGYLQAVEIYDGESTAEEIVKRLTGARPGAVVVWDGEEYTAKSTIAGALYSSNPRFDIWCVSENLRPDHEVAVGPGITAEATADPGVNRIVGDLSALLAGNTLGDQPGVKFVEIVDAAREHTSLADRLMVYRLKVRIGITLHNPESDRVPVQTFAVQREIGSLNGRPVFDPQNFIISGLDVPVVSGLTSTPRTGSAVVGGVAVNAAPPAHTFAPSSDVYRDLAADGSITYVTVANGGVEPPVTTNALRIGITVTNATDIVSDVFRAATLATLGDADVFPA